MNPQKWIDQGIAVIPCRYRSKRPVFAWRKYQNELPTMQDVNEWFKSRFVNTAIITGWRGLTIIDFDEWSIWELWKSWIVAKYPNLLDNTYRVKTRRGMHVYFLIDDAPKRTMKIGKIDVKANGGYCLCPNSIHPSGHQYRAINDKLTITTIDHLSDVMPGMLLEQARQDVVIPEYKHETSSNGEIDVWNIAPQSNNGDSIAYIKRHISILEFFPNAVPSGGNGRWYKCICPFHSDHAESGWIDTENNRFGCQSKCVARSIDVIDFYCKLKKCDRKQAIKELSK